jgi:hypothetical protein
MLPHPLIQSEQKARRINIVSLREVSHAGGLLAVEVVVL